MKLNVITIAVLIAIVTVGCASPEKKAAKAQQKYTEEKTKTLKDYKKCAKKASGDEKKQQGCEALLKALSASEGGTVETAEEGEASSASEEGTVGHVEDKK